MLPLYLLIMELSFDAILSSKLCNENSDAGHIKSPRGFPPTPALAPLATINAYNVQDLSKKLFFMFFFWRHCIINLITPVSRSGTARSQQHLDPCGTDL